jgi:hypothetical protein
MGRKKLEPATEVVVAKLERTPKHVAEQESKVRELHAAVIEQFGEGLPYNREHYVSEIRRDMARTVEAALAIGRKLIVMRELEPHGGWLDCLNQTGLGQDTAHRMMAAARRMDALPNSASTRNLALAAGNQTKLFELMTLDDAQFTALAEGDEAAGLTLDDVEKLTVKELRAALREAKADIAAKDERAAKREREIERKTSTISQLKRDAAKAEPDELAIELRGKLANEILGIEAMIAADGKECTSLRTRVRDLIEQTEQHGIDHAAFLAGAFAQIERQLHILRDEFAIEATVSGNPTPDWIAEGKKKGVIR